MSVTPERRFLGLEVKSPDDRTLLALPKDALKSGQIEAALERRADEIARHPLAGGLEAKRLLQQLELAADRLQAELALSGKGPLHPIAARRAAVRLRSQSMDAASKVKQVVVAPSAVSKPGIGLSSDDLTEFDRVALAVLVVSGGWNATSAKRLATIAEDYQISIGDLERVVLGLTEFLSQGEGMRSAMGDVGDSARSSWMGTQHRGGIDAAEGAVERVFTRINDVLRDEVGGHTAASQARLIAAFAIFALSWMAALGYLFFWNDGGDSSAGSGNTPDVATSGAPDSKGTEQAVARTQGDVDANGKPIGPIAALAAPAKFPRPPGFVATPTPGSVAEAASGAAVWLVDLDEAARALAAGGGRVEGSSESTRALGLMERALGLAADSWPAAGGYRNDAVRAFGSVVRVAQGADSLRRVMQLVPGSASATGQRALPPWQRQWRLAFGAGCLASIALDPSQSPEVATAAREEMRLRSIPIPRGTIEDPFASAAIDSLVASAPLLAEQLVFGSSTLEDVARWNEAVFAASRSPRLRIRALTAAIDAVLRAPGALDQPGPIVDALAYFIRSLDFTGRGAEADAVRTALGAWLVDAKIPPTRIWVFTSLLDADLGIAWYGPDLVLATNADSAARTVLAQRVDKAFPRVTVTSIGEAISVETSQLELWKTKLAAVRALPSGNTSARLCNAAASLALARLVRAYERDDEKMSKLAVSVTEGISEREAKDWIASPSGLRSGLQSTGIPDGSFADEWKARDSKSRLEAIRTLRARPAAGDLGPIDARMAASEALRGGQADVRAELCSVLLEKYANGREVLRATLDALADSGVSEDGRIFVGQLSGASVAGRDWVSEGRRALLDKIYELDDSGENAIDAACAEIATQATALAVAFGGHEGSSVLSTRPDRSLSGLVDALRVEAASRFLAEPFPTTIDEIERLRNARRSLAISVTQRMAAESAALVDYAAMLVAARQPALRSKLTELLTAARRARAGGQSASAQIQGDVDAMLGILGESLAPKATERSNG